MYEISRPIKWVRIQLFIAACVLLVAGLAVIGSMYYINNELKAQNTALLSTVDQVGKINAQLTSQLAAEKAANREVQERLASALVPEQTVSEWLTNHVTNPVKRVYESVTDWIKS